MDMTDEKQQVLLAMGAEIMQTELPPVKTLPCDKFLASSAMQKAIRRGHEESAMRAALTLWHIDRKNLWRRLHVISLEDVGVVSPDVVAKVLIAYAASAWRKKMGDERVMLFLVRLLCRAVKIRMADEMYSVAAVGREYESVRERFAWLDDQSLTDIAADPGRKLPERLLGLWFLAGKRYPHDNLAERRGSLDLAIEVMTAIKAPPLLTAACVDVLKRTEYPLALFTPHLFEEVAKHKAEATIVRQEIDQSEVEGIPLAAADRFTRVGKASLREFHRTVPTLRQFSLAQLDHALFFMDGAVVDRKLTSPALKMYEQAGAFADGESVALGVPEYLGLTEIMQQHFQTLQDIRQKHLKWYLADEAP